MIQVVNESTEDTRKMRRGTQPRRHILIDNTAQQLVCVRTDITGMLQTENQANATNKTNMSEQPLNHHNGNVFSNPHTLKLWKGLSWYMDATILTY